MSARSSRSGRPQHRSRGARASRANAGSGRGSGNAAAPPSQGVLPRSSTRGESARTYDDSVARLAGDALDRARQFADRYADVNVDLHFHGGAYQSGGSIGLRFGALERPADEDVILGIDVQPGKVAEICRLCPGVPFRVVGNAQSSHQVAHACRSAVEHLIYALCARGSGIILDVAGSAARNRLGSRPVWLLAPHVQAADVNRNASGLEFGCSHRLADCTCREDFGIDVGGILGVNVLYYLTPDDVAEALLRNGVTHAYFAFHPLDVPTGEAYDGEMSWRPAEDGESFLYTVAGGTEYHTPFEFAEWIARGYADTPDGRLTHVRVATMGGMDIFRFGIDNDSDVVAMPGPVERRAAVLPVGPAALQYVEHRVYEWPNGDFTVHRRPAGPRAMVSSFFAAAGLAVPTYDARMVVVRAAWVRKIQGWFNTTDFASAIGMARAHLGKSEKLHPEDAVYAAMVAYALWGRGTDFVADLRAADPQALAHLGSTPRVKWGHVALAASAASVVLYARHRRSSPAAMSLIGSAAAAVEAARAAAVAAWTATPADVSAAAGDALRGPVAVARDAAVAASEAARGAATAAAGAARGAANTAWTTSPADAAATLVVGPVRAVRDAAIAAAHTTPAEAAKAVRDAATAAIPTTSGAAEAAGGGASAAARAAVGAATAVRRGAVAAGDTAARVVAAHVARSPDAQAAAAAAARARDYAAPALTAVRDLARLYKVPTCAAELDSFAYGFALGAVEEAAFVYAPVTRWLAVVECALKLRYGVVPALWGAVCHATFAVLPPAVAVPLHGIVDGLALTRHELPAPTPDQPRDAPGDTADVAAGSASVLHALGPTAGAAAASLVLCGQYIARTRTVRRLVRGLRRRFNKFWRAQRSRVGAWTVVRALDRRVNPVAYEDDVPANPQAVYVEGFGEARAKEMLRIGPYFAEIPLCSLVESPEAMVDADRRRHAMVQTGDAEVVAEFAAYYTELMERIWRGTTPMPFERWVERYPTAGKRAALRLARETYLRGGFGTLHPLLSAFMKHEAGYHMLDPDTGLLGRRDKPGRKIQAPHLSVNVVTGPFHVAYAAQAKRGSHWGFDEVFPRIAYASGRDREWLSAWYCLARREAAPGEAWAIVAGDDILLVLAGAGGLERYNIDCSRLDSSIRPEITRAEALAGAACVSEHTDDFVRIMEKMVVCRGTDRFGGRFKVDGTRPSGITCTTSANTTFVACEIKWAEEHGARTVEEFAAAVAQLGTTWKIERVSASGVTFCQGAFWPCQPFVYKGVDVDVCWGPLPGRLMARLGHTLASVRAGDEDTYLASVGQSLVAACAHVPIAAALTSGLAARSRKTRKRFEKRLQFKGGAAGFAPAVWDFMVDRYGLTRVELREAVVAVRRAVRAKRDMVIESASALRIARVDNGLAGNH